MSPLLLRLVSNNKVYGQKSFKTITVVLKSIYQLRMYFLW